MPPVTEMLPPVQLMFAVVKLPVPLPTEEAVTVEGADAGLPTLVAVPMMLNTQVGPEKLEGAATGPPAFAGIEGTEESGPLAGEPDDEDAGAGAGAAVAVASNKQRTLTANMLPFPLKLSG